MITLFSTQLPTVMNVFAEGKQQTFTIREQIPFVEAQVTANIPTPESILNALPVITTPDQFAEIQRKFIKLKEDCEKVKMILSKAIEQIDSILSKMDRIEQIFGTLNGFISLLSEFIPLLRVINGTMQIVLAAQVFPIASGTVTVRAGDALKFVKSKIKEIDALAKLSESITRPVLNGVDEIQEELIPLRDKLQQVLSEVTARCFYLDNVLLNKLKELELSMSQNPSTGGGESGAQGTGVSQDTETIVNQLASQFEPELILDNLENSNKERFIEYLTENGFTGYQIVKK